jgi:putative membrane protein
MIAYGSDLLAVWMSLSLAVRVAMAGWLAATLALPIVTWLWGERGVPWSVSLGVVLQVAAVLAILATEWGPWRALVIAVAVPAMGWTVEYIGSTTGIPFGRYHYTDRLQPQVGHVPMLIPLAWLMMLPPAWAVASAIAGGNRVAFVLLSALAFSAWDLFLDPQMVGWRLWVWDQPGGYFGIPWVNYLGWAFASAAITAVVRPWSIPTRSLQLIYVMTWTLETGALGVFWRQPGPAICGFLGMGIMLAWAWLADGIF